MSVRINGTTGVTTPNLTATTKVTTADLANTGNYNGGQLGSRNLIINGAMQVAQRGTSATTFAYGTVDRFKPTEGSTSSLAITQTQDTNAPSGFSNSLKITVTTAETMSGSKQLAVFHAMEAQNLQQLGYGTSEAKSITCSFWVKSSVTGVYCLSLYENDDNRNIGATYTINSANTWEYKTITFPPDTVGVINNDNGGGLETYFFLSVGPDRKSADNTSWATWSAARFGYGQVADVAGTTNATWQITGVQLEVGDTATPFEHRSYGDELAKCQRYTFIYQPQYYQAFPVFGAGSNTAKWFPTFPVGMRTKPTLITKDVSSTIQGFNYVSGSAIAFQSFTLSEGGDLASAVIVTFDNTNNGIANGVFGHWRWIATPTGSYVGFDAEL